MSGYSQGRRVGRYGIEGFTRQDYFWRHVDKTGDCWLWTAYTNRRGYGQFGIGSSRTMLAHRFSYELHKGPLGHLMALHHCDNPHCVNPEHLYAGTAKDNVADMLSRGRHKANAGESSGMAKLTTADVREIRRRYEPGLNRWIRGNSAELAREFGVSQTHIQSIVSGQWRRNG